jgi:hypothetical protein
MRKSVPNSIREVFLMWRALSGIVVAALLCVPLLAEEEKGKTKDVR